MKFMAGLFTAIAVAVVLSACGGGGSGGATLSAADLPGWRTAASFSVARSLHSATLLPNGKVLIVGGRNSRDGGLSYTYLGSAELYDPATNSWAPAAALAAPRAAHSTTLLPNGRILVAGGVDALGRLSSAELYDPAADLWTPAAAMTTRRSAHSATLLPNGKVLVAGGDAFTANRISSAELYDPASGSWSAAASLAANHGGHAATLLASGKVLVIGGLTTYAELYDPVRDAWAPAGTVAFRFDIAEVTLPAATALPDGRILVSGGYYLNAFSHFHPPEAMDDVELYDATTNAWTIAAPLINRRAAHTATLLGNGKVLVAGGGRPPLVGNYISTLAAETFDPASGTWSGAGVLAAGRSLHTATLLGNGKVLLVGGEGDDGNMLASSELFTPN